MEYKFQILKTSWGIVIFSEIEDVTIQSISQKDIRVTDNFYLNFLSEKQINEDLISYWFSLAIKDLESELTKIIQDNVIRYEIISIDYSNVDFQEEALYYVMQGWLSKRYK